MTQIIENTIEKSIEIRADMARVWAAISDYREFGEWFGVALEGPFVAGEFAQGRFTIKGMEKAELRILIQTIQPPDYFAYRWHPFAIDPDKDYSHEERTLVELRLKPTATGTLLTVTESGFSSLPADRMPEAMRMNTKGWTAQLGNVKAYVER